MRDKVISHIRAIMRSRTSIIRVERSELEKLDDATLFQLWIVISKTPFTEEAAMQ